MRIGLACDERCDVALRATALGRTAAVRRQLVLAAGSRVVFPIAVRRAARAAIARRLRADRAVTLRVRVTATDDAGNATSRTLTVRISP